MTTSPIRRYLLLAAAGFFTLLTPSAAQRRATLLEQQVLETMKRATAFMMDTVSCNGGFVWNYLPDFSRSWGEMEAKRTMAWVQSPGTPGVGHLLLDVYHATGDEYFYQQAERVAAALIWGQLECGGWNYMFDFAGEASLKDWYATIGRNGWRLEEFQHYYGNATFDDGGTVEAGTLLLRMYVEKYDPKYKPALDKAIDFVLESQYPIGGWPQRYPLRYDYSKKGNPDYSSYITLNDDVAGGNIRFLIHCYQALGEQRVLEPIMRAMNCLRILQQGAPQAGWAMQYDRMLQPCGARSYEPNGIASNATSNAIGQLMDFYRMTGDTKYLIGIPAALDFLESASISADDLVRLGRSPREGELILPTIVEIGTGLPRYIHRRGSNVTNGEYYFDRDITHTVGHYGSTRGVAIASLRSRYEQLLNQSKEEVTQGSPLLSAEKIDLPRYFTTRRGEASEEAARRLVDGLNERGYWPARLNTTSNPYIGPGKAEPDPSGDYRSTDVGDRYDTSPYPAAEPVMGISSSLYINNMFTLARYIETVRE
jgi:PelA/Pel-15E family pectate lyase